MEIYKNIHEVKKEMGKIYKDSTNPFFKSNYLSLNGLIEHCEPLLQKNNLILLQPITDGCVVTKIIDVESAEHIESSIQLPTIQDPQKLGSAITYYRRYTLQSLLGLQAEDDDGNSVAKQPQPKKEDKDRKPAFKEGGFEYLTAKATPMEHIEKALLINRMTPAQRIILEKLVKTFDLTK